MAGFLVFMSNQSKGAKRPTKTDETTLAARIRLGTIRRSRLEGALRAHVRDLVRALSIADAAGVNIHRAMRPMTDSHSERHERLMEKALNGA